MKLSEIISNYAASRLSEIQSTDLAIAPTEVCGDDFILSVKTHAKSDKNLPITVNRWHEEYMRLIADFRVHHTITTGAAQVGKTLFHYLLYLYTVSKLELNCMWVFSQERTMQKCVTSQYHPIADAWCESAGLKALVKSTTLYKLKQSRGTGLFTHAGGGNSNKSTGAAAGNSIVSNSADILFFEERSQYPAKVVSAARRRLDASRFPKKPIRELGTPGNGAGIEVSVKQAHKYFYPAIHCPHCSKLTYLDPKGALLLPTHTVNDKGDEVKRYWSESNQPDKFFSRDGSIDGAYIGCNHCGGEISDGDRLNAGFYDRKTGEWLIDWLNTADMSKLWIIAINLSPLLRQTSFSLAYEIIKEGAISSNPDDWIQQCLGIPTEPEAACMDRDKIIDNIGLLWDSDKSVVVAGLDQGTSSDYLSIVRFHFPENWKEIPTQRTIDGGFRDVLFSDRIKRSQLPHLLSQYGVQFAVIDNEPEKDWAASFSQTNENVLPADQIDKLKVPYDLSTRTSGGREFAVLRIRTPRYKARLVRLTNKGNYHFPLVWKQYASVDAGFNPISHCTSVSYDEKLDKWIRPDSHNDDIFFSLMFAESAIEYYVAELFQNNLDWYNEKSEEEPVDDFFVAAEEVDLFGGF